jgi:ATP synthase protein I
MSDEPSDRNTGDDARIDALGQRLQAAREREEGRGKSGAGAEADANYRMGNRVLAELIGGIGGGAFVGWVVDQVIGYFTGKSQHAGLLVVMALGIIVAFRNIIRTATKRPD